MVAQKATWNENVVANFKTWLLIALYIIFYAFIASRPKGRPVNWLVANHRIQSHLHLGDLLF